MGRPALTGWRAVTLIRAPTHLPEVGFEPGGLLEDRDQVCLPGRRGVEIGETIQLRQRLRRDLLVGRAGIFGDIQTLYGLVAASAPGCAASRVAISA